MNSLNVSNFFAPTNIYVGINSHQKLEEIIPEWKMKKVFVLCDQGVATTDFFKSIENILTTNRVKFDIFTGIDPEPSDRNVENAYDAYQTNKASVLLAVGGGSTIDVAKAVGIIATNGGQILDYVGRDKFSKPPLPIIAIPTTAGTGSEASYACAIMDTQRNLKVTIYGVVLNRPKIAILDPLGLTSLPATVATHAAIDAFVHVMESYFSLQANPMTDAINLHAIELIAHNIRPFVSNRSNIDAGLKMLCGASFGGLAISMTGTGNVHCMARFVGAFFHVSHGLSNAVCLPHVVEFNLPSNPQKFARLALAMGENIHGLTTLEAGRKAVEAVKQLSRDLSIPQKLSDIGATEDKLPELARLSFEAGYNKVNPRYTTYEDFLGLFERAF